jgi:hypothetical protein
MDRRLAGLLLIGVSLVLAVLLLTDVIEPVTGGALFVITVAILARLSHGFRQRTGSPSSR